MESPLFQGSQLISNKALDLFTIPSTDFAVIKSDYQQIGPTNQIKGREIPISFRIEKSLAGFLDLKDSFLLVRASIKRNDGTNLQTTDIVAPENLFLHTMFQNVNVKLNGVTVCDTNFTYPYHSWILKQFTTGAGIKESYLTSELYFKDKKPDDFSQANKSFQSRLNISKNSSSFETIGRISNSIFELQRYLPGNVVVDVQLTQSMPEFCISAQSTETGYYVDLEEAYLYVRRHSIHPTLSQKIQQEFNRGPAYYPFLKNEMKVTHIPKGLTTFVSESMFRGILPEVLCIGLVSHEAFTGAYNKSPFNFRNYNLSKLTVTIDDHPVVYRAIECNYEQNQYLMGYNTLKKGAIGSCNGNDISIADYLQGNVMYVLDVSPHRASELHSDKVGEMKIRVSFSRETPEVVTLVVFGQMQSMFTVDKQGNVQLEYRDI